MLRRKYLWSIQYMHFLWCISWNRLSLHWFFYSPMSASSSSIFIFKKLSIFMDMMATIKSISQSITHSMTYSHVKLILPLAESNTACDACDKEIRFSLFIVEKTKEQICSLSLILWSMGQMTKQSASFHICLMNRFDSWLPCALATTRGINK